MAHLAENACLHASVWSYALEEWRRKDGGVAVRNMNNYTQRRAIKLRIVLPVQRNWRHLTSLATHADTGEA